MLRKLLAACAAEESRLLATDKIELFALPVAVAATLLKLETTDAASLVAVETAPLA
jgi:hypothetical protein